MTLTPVFSCKLQSIHPARPLTSISRLIVSMLHQEAVVEAAAAVEVRLSHHVLFLSQNSHVLLTKLLFLSTCDRHQEEAVGEEVVVAVEVS